MDSFLYFFSAQMSPDLLQVISWFILASLMMNEIFLMTWRGDFFLDVGRCFYFDDKEEEDKIKIRKWIRMTFWCSRWRGRGDDRYGAMKEKESLCMSQDLFFYPYFLHFLLNCGILARPHCVHQSFSHTADCFIEKWLKKANSKRHKKEGKKKGSVKTVPRNRWRDRNSDGEMLEGGDGETWGMFMKQSGSCCYHNK